LGLISWLNNKFDYVITNITGPSYVDRFQNYTQGVPLISDSDLYRRTQKWRVLGDQLERRGIRRRIRVFKTICDVEIQTLRFT
jgi:hypothetical protein